MKVCLKCDIEKPFESFGKNKRNKDGYQIYCKACRKQEYEENKDIVLSKQKEYYARTRDSQVQKRRAYYQNNKEKVLESIRKYNEERPHKKREDYLKRNYGIDLKIYEKMLEDQNHACAVCGDKADYNLVVDHNHKTGETRGLLCQPCNQALGLLKDNPTIIQSAQKYLIEKGHYGQEVAGSP